MKPNFALDLSLDGITLFHRSPSGAWSMVGEVMLDDPQIKQSLGVLRSTAVGLEGKGFGSKLVLPNTQILYQTVLAPGPGETERRAQIMAALEGATPYDVADLTFDWTGDGDEILVAVVANVTLDEAEEFAVEHRFNPISFVARASDEPGAWEPFFGRTDYSYVLLSADVDVRDTPAPVMPGGLLAAEDGSPEELEPDNLFVEEDEAAGTETWKDPLEGASDAVQDEQVETAAPDAPIGTAASEMSEDPPVEAVRAEFAPADQSDGDSAIPPIPSFSSRRTGDAPAAEVDPEDLRLSKIRPKITLTAETPAALSAPSLVGDVRAPEVDPPEPSRRPAFAKLRAAKKNRPPRAPRTGPSLSDRLKGAAGTTLGVGAVLGARGLAGVKNVVRFSRERLKARRQKPAPEAEITPALAGLATADAAPDRGRKRRVAILSVAGLVGVLTLLYLVYSLTAGNNLARDEEAEVVDAVLSTTATERGVNETNRPKQRPDDFEERLAAFEADPTNMPPIRPERRSLFEGETDPLAGLPDTAEEATELTAEEIASIRAAGLPMPTDEELAEGGEPEVDELSAEELARLYAESGIQQGVEALQDLNNAEDRDDIYVAGLDRQLLANDAIILPNFNTGVADYPPPPVVAPLSPDITFDLDVNGLVKATADGAMAPSGVLIFAGKPGLTPPERPAREDLVPPDPLAALKPKARPEALKTGVEAIYIQGKLTLPELRAFRAKSRPASEQMEALAALVEQGGSDISELAILTSYQPQHRPSDFEEKIASIRDSTVSAARSTDPVVDTSRPATTGPILPSSASVAKQATMKNAINLSELNLIGVSGKAGDRRALLRLPSGRYVRVKAGDRVNGGQVAAIDVNSIRYVKSGRNRTLKMP